MNENLKSNNGNEEEKKPEPKLTEALIDSLKKTEYYMIELPGHKFLSRDNLPILYHKSAWYKNEATSQWTRAYEVSADQANGKPTTADKALAKLHQSIKVHTVVVVGKLITKTF